MSSKTFKLAALAGDGIGREVMREAIKVLRAVEKRFSLQFDITEAPVGWAGIDAAGKALPDATLDLCRKSDSILFGSVGLPDRDPTIPKEERPERAALLRLRKEFSLFANLRPVKLSKQLAHACPLSLERQGSGIDVLVVRELTGGMYFGQPKKTEQVSPGVMRAIDTMVYTTPEIERIAHVAFFSFSATMAGALPAGTGALVLSETSVWIRIGLALSSVMVSSKRVSSA